MFKNLINKNSLKIFLLFAICYLLFVIPASGQTMKNDSYIIQMGHLNEAAGKSTGANYKLNQTVGQTGPGLYSGTNYKVRAGFQYISSIIPFSFKISSTVIDFATLTPTNPVTRANILTVNNQSGGGYSVKAAENHQLLIPSSAAVIPDTTCDSGACTESTSDTWTSTLTFGFGFRCDQVDATNYCVSGFSNSTYYRQFADNSLSETSQTFMSGQSGRNQRAQVSYKANISGSQLAGLYSNVVTYIATPTY